MMHRLLRLRLALRLGVLLPLLLAVTYVPAARAAIDTDTLRWLQSTLDAWDQACREDLHISPPSLPWMIIFNRDLAWHINPDTKLLPEFIHTGSSVHFRTRAYEVFEVKNNGSLWVPGRRPMAIKPVTVTMLYGLDNTPFLIGASPALVAESSHVEPSSMGDLSKFLHSMQSKGHFPEHLDDNFVETEFGRNQEYRHLYHEEEKHLSSAFLTKDRVTVTAQATEALKILDERRKPFFVRTHSSWGEINDIFLALEGSGMWVQYKTALRLAPAGQSRLDTLATLSQRTNAWSLSEGLGMFLLLDRIDPGWQKQFFGTSLPSPAEQIRRLLTSEAIAARK